jgi:uracil DNA glycosylase
VHKDIGWNPLTRATLRVLSETQNNVHFILMGVKAQKYRGCIDAQKNIVSHTFHPQARGLKHKFIDGFNAIPNNPLL